MRVTDQVLKCWRNTQRRQLLRTQKKEVQNMTQKTNIRRYAPDASPLKQQLAIIVQKPDMIRAQPP